MDGGLEVLCGLSLDGARLTEVEDLAVGRASVGCAVFGPSGLLQDLEDSYETRHAAALALWAQDEAFEARHHRPDQWEEP